MLFPKLAKRRTWLMVRKDLERVGIPYKDDQGRVADFHAAGRHTHITELLRNGASVPEAMELARHSDVKMTMRYAHIGIEDQAKALSALPAPKRAQPAARAASEKAESKTLITGAYEGRLIWWNLLSQTPTPQRTIDAHQGYVRAITISPDGRYVVTGGNDNLVKVWSTIDGTLIQELSGHARHVYNVAFHPDGEHIVSGDLMGVLKQWQVGTWSHVRDLDAGVLVGWDKKFQADCGGIRGMDFSPDGKSLAVAGISEVTNAFAGTGKPTVVVFDWETGQRLHVLTPKTNSSGACWGMRWHRSGEFIVGAGGGSTGSLWFWKPNEENSFFDFKTPSVPFDVAFHPDGLRLAVALYDQTVRIYDLAPKLKTETNTETGS